jgi:hypothetical protein
MSANAQSQNDKITSIVISGSGKTQEEAKNNTLKSAISQTFGAFISSRSEINNDSLVEDNIVSISNGTIKKYDIISQLEVNGIYYVTLKVEISLLKLTNFIKSKGGAVSINAEMLSRNYENDIISYNSEEKIIEQNVEILKDIIPNIFDYEIEMGKPKISESIESWDIPLKISMVSNNNSVKVIEYLKEIFTEICLSKDKVKEYKQINKKYYDLQLGYGIFAPIYYFRNIKSIEKLNSLLEIFMEYTNPKKFFIWRKTDADPQFTNLKYLGVSYKNITGTGNSPLSWTTSSSFSGFTTENNKEGFRDIELKSPYYTLFSFCLNKPKSIYLKFDYVDTISNSDLKRIKEYEVVKVTTPK